MPFDFNVSKIVKVPKYTGKNHKTYSLSIFGENINLSLFNKKFKSSVEYADMKQLKFGKDYPLPIIFIKNIELETKYEKKVLSENEMINLANRSISSKIISELNFDTDVIDKKLNYEVTDKGIRVKGYLVVLEEIDEKRELNIDKITNQAIDQTNGQTVDQTIDQTIGLSD